MICNNKIHTELFSLLDFLNGSDATISRDYKAYPILREFLDGVNIYSIPLFYSVRIVIGNISVYVF